MNSQLKDEASSFLNLAADKWNPQPCYNLEERRLLAELIYYARNDASGKSARASACEVRRQKRDGTLFPKL